MLCVPSLAINDFIRGNVITGTGMYIGYYRVISDFYWVSGCTSSFTKWNTGRPDGGSYVGMGPAGNWDDSDSSAFYCSCQFTQSAAPTVVPTVVPTFIPTLPPIPNPTCVPTTKPTVKPTATPTMAITDCTVSCSFLTGGSALGISYGQLFAKVLMPPNFKIQFDVYVGGLATYPQVRNILELSDADGTSLYRVGLPDSNNLRVAYNNIVVNNFGPALPSSYTSVYSTVTTGYAYGTVQTVTYYTDSPTVASYVDTTGIVYNLYLSNVDGMPSSSGMIKNIYITG